MTTGTVDWKLQPLEIDDTPRSSRYPLHPAACSAQKARVRFSKNGRTGTGSPTGACRSEAPAGMVETGRLATGDVYTHR